MRVSVVMCTYNGTRFVEQQLASILGQRRPPDDVVVRDDASSDDTVAIVRRLAAVSQVAVRVEVAPANAGVAANFSAALALAAGDVVFLADQDDIWEADNIERMVRAFDDPRVDLVLTNGQVVDADGQPLGHTLWDWCRFTSVEQRAVRAGDALSVFLRKNVATGAALAVRARLLDLALPIPPGCLHDEWIGLLAAASTRVALEPATLIRYRQHGGNLVGAAHRGIVERLAAARRVDNRARLTAQLHLVRAAAERLRSVASAAQALRSLDAKAAHLERRLLVAAQPWGARLVGVAREVVSGGYHRYSDPRHALRDLLAPRA